MIAMVLKALNSVAKVLVHLDFKMLRVSLRDFFKSQALILKKTKTSLEAFSGGRKEKWAMILVLCLTMMISSPVDLEKWEWEALAKCHHLAHPLLEVEDKKEFRNPSVQLQKR